MQISTSALQRVRSAQLRPDAIATIFEHMAACAELHPGGRPQFVLDYEDPDMPAGEGDLIPVIILSLRPANHDRATVDIPEQPTG